MIGNFNTDTNQKETNKKHWMNLWCKYWKKKERGGYWNEVKKLLFWSEKEKQTHLLVYLKPHIDSNANGKLKQTNKTKYTP